MSHGSPQPITWTPDKVRQFWNSIELCHLSEKAFAKNAGDALIEIIRPHLPSGGKLIDFGAGSGELSQKLIEAGFYVAALEPSTERQKSILARIGGDKHWLGFLDDQPSASFDAVLLVEVLEHLSPDDAPFLLKRAISYLRPGGFLVITTPNCEDIKAAEVYCPDCNQLFHPWQHLQSVTYTRLLELTSLHGIEKTYLSLADFSADKEIVEELKWRHQEAHARDVRDALMDKHIRQLREQLGEQRRELSLRGTELEEIEQCALSLPITPNTPLKIDRERIFSLFSSLDHLPWPKRLWATLRLARNVRPLLHLFLESHNELSEALGRAVRHQETIRQSLAALRHRIFVTVTHLDGVQKYLVDHALTAALDAKNAPVGAVTSTPVVDSKVGKETTIVFVGQKR